jgi:putative ABC transport system substrate-binding protein
MTRARRALAAVLVALAPLGAACGDDAGGDDEAHATIAFLRAVAGAPSTEPAFVEELRRAGFREGENLTILAGDADIAYPDPDEAAEVLRRWRDEEGVDLVVALSSSGATVASRALPDVDVLFLSNDPSATGLVADEDAPEGRLTGVTFRVPADRTLAIAARAVPGLVRVGLAYPPDDPAAVANLAAVEAAADEAGLTLVTAEFDEAGGPSAAVDELAAQGIDALLISTSPVATRALPETLDAAATHRLPVVANTTLAETAVVSLSPDTDELGRQLGRQAARLLGGAAVRTVPVEDPARFVLVLNAAVASSLGIDLPADLLREANRVVE